MGALFFEIKWIKGDKININPTKIKLYSIKCSIKTISCNHYIIRSLTEFITKVNIVALVDFPSIVKIFSDWLNFSIIAT